MRTIYYRLALGIWPRVSYSVSKNSMEAAKKIRAQQFIFTSVPSEFSSEAFCLVTHFPAPNRLLNYASLLVSFGWGVGVTGYITPFLFYLTSLWKMRCYSSVFSVFPCTLKRKQSFLRQTSIDNAVAYTILWGELALILWAGITFLTGT